MKRLLSRALLTLALIAAFLLVGALGYRAWRQQETAQALAITTPYGIAEQSFVRLNGLDQWVTIRGEDRRNPVVLVIAGATGSLDLSEGVASLAALHASPLASGTVLPFGTSSRTIRHNRTVSGVARMWIVR